MPSHVSRLLARVLPLRSGEAATGWLMFAYSFLAMTAYNIVKPITRSNGLVFGLLLISQFWTLANDLYDSRQARRLFGFIGGGASLGGFAGAAVTTYAVELVGTENLLPLSAAALVPCIAIVLAIGRRERPSRSVPSTGPPQVLASGLRLG